MELQAQAELKIKRIKQISFTIDEFALIESPECTVANSLVQLDYKSGYNLEENYFDFTLRATYLFPETNKIFLRSEVLNAFEIKDIKQFVDDKGELRMPSNALIVITSLSISHMRALLSLNVAATVYTDIVLPIFDPKAVAKHFFGDKVKLDADTKQIEETKKD